MPQVCPRCKAPVSARSVRCPECGTGLEAAPPAPAPARAPVVKREALPVEAADPAPPLFLDAPSFETAPVEAPSSLRFDTPVEPGKPAVVPPPRPAAPPAPPARAVLDAVPSAATPEPYLAPVPEATSSATLAAQGLYEEASDVQAWMARMLAGATDEHPPMPQPPDPAEPPGTKYLPPPDPPMIFYPMLDEPDGDWADESFPPVPSLLDAAEEHVFDRGSVATLAPPSDQMGLVDDDLIEPDEPAEEFVEPELPTPTVRLELLDGLGEWVDWGDVPAEGRVIGRDGVEAHVPGAEALADEHLALTYEGTSVVVDDLGSVDGVYRRIGEPVVLGDGQRFRVGGHVLEFRLAGDFPAAPPLVSESRGTLCTRDLAPLAYIDLIRPDGQAGLRFPLTKRDATVVGREGPTASIALTGDQGVSASHAQVCVREAGFVLEDLKSRGGTFLQLQGPTLLRTGDVLQAGKLMFRIADA